MKHLRNFTDYEPVSENIFSTDGWVAQAKDFLNKSAEKGKELVGKGEELVDKGLDTVDDFTGRMYHVDKNGLMFASVIDRHLGGDAEEFKRRVIDISNKLRINPNWLLVVINKESSFNTKAKNPYGSASGLLQMIDSTARSVGTTSSELRGMSAVRQLEYIYRYFKPHAGQMNSVEDVYMLTFNPSYFKYRNDPDKVIATGSTVSSNKIIDLNKDGIIKMGEFKQYVRKGLPQDINKKYA